MILGNNSPEVMVAATPDGWRPPAGMPSHAQLRWVKEGIIVALLVLALPWLVWKLVTDPSRVLTGAGARAA